MGSVNPCTFLSFLRNPALDDSETGWPSKQHSPSFLSQVPALSSCPDFSQWWSMTWQWHKFLSSPKIVFVIVFCHSNRKETRALGLTLTFSKSTRHLLSSPYFHNGMKQFLGRLWYKTATGQTIDNNDHQVPSPRRYICNTAPIPKAHRTSGKRNVK